MAIIRLQPVDASQLESLRAAYAAEMGGRPRPDSGFAATLLTAPSIIVWGAVTGEDLTGFAVVFELPETVFATTCGMLDDVFVLAPWRGRGIARSLIGAAAEHGRSAGWSHLRWLVPHDDEPAIRLYESLAARAPWLSFVMRFDPRRPL